MARIRTVKPELHTDPTFGSWPIASRLGFIALLSEADDAGRFRAHPAYLRVKLLPYDRGIDGAAMMRPWLDAGWIALYEVGGQPYGVVVGWSDKESLVYQVINKPQASRLPIAPVALPEYYRPGREDSGSAPVALPEDSGSAPVALPEGSGSGSGDQGSGIRDPERHTNAGPHEQGHGQERARDPDPALPSGLPPIDIDDEEGRPSPVAHLTASSADEEVGRQVLAHIAEVWGQENTWQASKRRLLAIVRAYPLEDIRGVVDWHARPEVRRRLKNAPTVAWVFKDAETFENWRNQARAEVPRNGHAQRPAAAPASPPTDPDRQRCADLEAALVALAEADARWTQDVAAIRRDQGVSLKGAQAELHRRRRRQEGYIEQLGGTAPPPPAPSQQERAA